MEFIATQPRQGKPGVPAILNVIENFRRCDGIKSITSGMKTTRCVVRDFDHDSLYHSVICSLISLEQIIVLDNSA